MDCWFEGITLAFASRPSPAVSPGYQSGPEDREVASSEPDRLAPLGKIHWNEDGSYPPDLCVCASHLIA